MKAQFTLYPSLFQVKRTHHMLEHWIWSEYFVNIITSFLHHTIYHTIHNTHSTFNHKMNSSFRLGAYLKKREKRNNILRRRRVWQHITAQQNEKKIPRKILFFFCSVMKMGERRRNMILPSYTIRNTK